MSIKSEKHRTFVGEPIRDKPVTDLTGIGDVLGKRLNEKGFDFAYNVLGQFLVLGKNYESFVSWLKDTTEANQEQSRDCYNCLKEWCESYID